MSRESAKRSYERYKTDPEYRARKQEYQREYHQRRKNDPDYQEKRRERYRVWSSSPENRARRYVAELARRYGISADEYYALRASQDNRCASCGSDAPLVVDHCHRTGRVRGLLCNGCNTALGHLKEDIRIMQALINYTAKL